MRALFALSLLLSLVACGCNSNTDTSYPYMKCQAGVKPTLYIAGDSTVHNTNGELRGWGDVLGDYFDTEKINVINRGRGGRSSRTFINEGLWDELVDMINPGDYVMIQFGHNDGGPIAKGKARASLKGIGHETQTVTVEKTGKEEVVMSYGGYLRKYINDAKAKGAAVIICSPIPRNMWNKEKSRVNRNDKDYGLWAKQIAQECQAEFINLNEITALKYETAGSEYVGSEYFLKDHTHTTIAGAIVNAESVVEGVKGLEKCCLKKFVK